MNTDGNVLLTGATGTIGSAILEVLSECGRYRVDCIIRHRADIAYVEANGATPIVGDMTDPAIRQRVPLNREYDYIIHAAQEHYSTHTDEQIDRADSAAIAVLQAIASKRTKMMVYTSGVWIFGDSKTAPITENTSRRPFLAACRREKLMRDLERQDRYPWLHICPPSIVYGTRGPLARIVDELKQGPINIIDDEEVLWSVIERIDLAKAYLAVLKYGTRGDFYVVAEDSPVSQVAFYEKIARLIPGCEINRRPLEYFRLSKKAWQLETLYGSQVVDSTNLKDRTGWRAETVFESWIQTNIRAMVGTNTARVRQ